MSESKSKTWLQRAMTWCAGAIGSSFALLGEAIIWLLASFCKFIWFWVVVACDIIYPGRLKNVLGDGETGICVAHKKPDCGYCTVRFMCSIFGIMCGGMYVLWALGNHGFCSAQMAPFHFWWVIAGLVYLYRGMNSWADAAGIQDVERATGKTVPREISLKSEPSTPFASERTTLHRPSSYAYEPRRYEPPVEPKTAHDTLLDEIGAVKRGRMTGEMRDVFIARIEAEEEHLGLRLDDIRALLDALIAERADTAETASDTEETPPEAEEEGGTR